MYPLGESARVIIRIEMGDALSQSIINILKWSKRKHQEKERGYYWSWKNGGGHAHQPKLFCYMPFTFTTNPWIEIFFSNLLLRPVFISKIYGYGHKILQAKVKTVATKKVKLHAKLHASHDCMDYIREATNREGGRGQRGRLSFPNRYGLLCLTLPCTSLASQWECSYIQARILYA